MGSVQFLSFPFIKYFFEISLKVVEKAEKDIITFLRNPIVYLEEQPFIMVGKGIHKDSSKESVQYLDFSSIIEQLLFKKRIFCFQKYLFGSNSSQRKESFVLIRFFAVKILIVRIIMIVQSKKLIIHTLSVRSLLLNYSITSLEMLIN